MEKKEFDSYKEFEEFLNEYHETNFCVFKKRNSETVATYNSRRSKHANKISERFVYRRCVFTCTHFGNPRPRGTGCKLISKYSATGCEASFTLLYDDPSEKLRIIKGCFTHNHPTNADTYANELSVKRITSEQRDSLREVIQFHPRNENLLHYINSKFKKSYNLRDIRQLKFKLKKSIRENLSSDADTAKAELLERDFQTEAILGRLGVLLKSCGPRECADRLETLENLVEGWNSGRQMVVELVDASVQNQYSLQHNHQHHEQDLQQRLQKAFHQQQQRQQQQKPYPRLQHQLEEKYEPMQMHVEPQLSPPLPQPVSRRVHSCHHKTTTTTPQSGLEVVMPVSTSSTMKEAMPKGAESKPSVSMATAQS